MKKLHGAQDMVSLNNLLRLLDPQKYLLVSRPYFVSIAPVDVNKIIIFCKNEKEHIKHINLALYEHEKKNLYGKLPKFDCMKTSIECLERIVTSNSIKVGPKKQKLLKTKKFLVQ